MIYPEALMPRRRAILTGADRHKVENLFQEIKRYRRIAMCFEKLQLTFAAMAAIASIRVWIRF